MLTFICITIRLNSVPSIKNTINLNVFTVIIGKTLEENLTSFNMTISIYAKTGELELLLLSMQMDAKIWLVVSIVMDGKNKTIILWSIKLSHVQILKTILQK